MNEQAKKKLLIERIEVRKGTFDAAECQMKFDAGDALIEINMKSGSGVFIRAAVVF